MLRNRKVSACLQFSQAGIVQENWHQKYFHMYPRKPKLLSFTRLRCSRALLPAWVLYLLTYTSGENWACFQPAGPHPESSPLSWRHLSEAVWPRGCWQTPLHLQISNITGHLPARRDNSCSSRLGLQTKLIDSEGRGKGRKANMSAVGPGTSFK